MRYPLLVVAALLLSCGGDDGGVTAPDTGSLEIRATTTGEPGADYMVSVDGEPGRVLAPNGTLTIPDLEQGFHTVEILAPPPGCTVAGDNPRTVSVVPGSTNVVTFVVECVPLLGSIQVTTVTTGSGPATYELAMDGTSIGTIGSSATRIIENVPPGSHTIELGGIPATCQVQGAATQTVSVEPSSSAPVTFSITCPTVAAGTLEVTVSTSGSDPDPDGYAVVVDGGTPQPIGNNASITLTSVAAGTHTVRLDGVAANCSVSGPNPQAVSVPASGSATVTFAVTCAAIQPSTGTLRIVTNTSGSDVDQDGYVIRVNNREPTEMDPDDEVRLDLEPGTYTVTLSGAAENCTVSDDEQTAVVTAGTTEVVEFEITCNAVTGLRVITETSGPDQDDNGYVLLLDGQDFGRLDNTGERTIPELAPGEYIVELGEVADNCEVADENPRTVAVTAGEIAETEFSVTCSEPTGSIHVTVTTEGTPDDEFALRLDEGAPQPIDSNGDLTIEDVSEGSHELVLEVASNCEVTDGATREFEIIDAETEEVSYTVDCTSSSSARR
jgi:hypothetical protein